MRKINRTIAVRVRVPAAALLSTGRGGNAELPGRCLWAVRSPQGRGPEGRGPEESGWGLCRGPWTPRSEISHSARATRSHAPRPPALSQRRIYSPALPSRSRHLRARVRASAPLSLSHSFHCPLLQAQAPDPHRGCSPGALTAAGRGPRTADPRESGQRERG